MPLPASKSDLWSLVKGTPAIDPMELTAALTTALHGEHHDFRTRLLIRDSYRALESRWGFPRLSELLTEQARTAIKPILTEDLGSPGFPTLENRMADRTDPKTILQFLRELGTHVSEPARLDIGGSSALILTDRLHRGTDDIDVVDELPPSIRLQHAMLEQLADRYGLHLAHFQSHYLPTGWQSRVHSLDRFGLVEVYLVDAIDIFVGKLFSRRHKDLDDLRILERSIEKSVISERMRTSAQLMLAEESFRKNAEHNWYVLFGEPLPS